MAGTAKTTVGLAAGAAVLAGGVVWVYTDDSKGVPDDAARKAAPLSGHEGERRQAGSAAQRQPRLIGDGSTAYTGPQPGLPQPRRLASGERPPQFVVFSWDGAGEDDNRLFSRFRRLGHELGATQTFFLSGIYLLPESERMRYRPPGRPRGASDIGYLGSESIRRTLTQIRQAWAEGNEIATHFNGHFCGPTGVASWSPAQWRAETAQAKWFVKHWRTTTGWTTMRPLPFDYDEELIGGRTPCLEGRQNLLRAGRSMGFRYDSSGNGEQVWPRKKFGLWDLPLQRVPMPGRSFEVLSMDYNFLANQSKNYNGSPARRPLWKHQMRAGLMRGFARAYSGNRAPMVIGNHFERWNGGIYMDVVEDVMRDVCQKEEVRCVSFRQLVDWLDAQDPQVLQAFRRLGVGESPPDGWGVSQAEFLKKPGRRPYADGDS
ncbi:polysaccharide deacetylase family protein [Actinomadura rudentiformis]|uniref:hypothetical protein n=1 Tax=Actinomadura rudentiformis TaxID=359158 RepID=UPI00178C26BB|nr:hypothetical protein [Actinomadura rudentiformis]